MPRLETQTEQQVAPHIAKAIEDWKWFNNQTCSDLTFDKFVEMLADGEIVECEYCGELNYYDDMDYADYDSGGHDPMCCLQCKGDIGK